MWEIFLNFSDTQVSKQVKQQKAAIHVHIIFKSWYTNW